MKELLAYIVKSLVDKPEDVSVDMAEEDNALRFKLKVSDPDKGKVIGKEGKVIKAIRTVMTAGTAKDSKRVFVDIE